MRACRWCRRWERAALASLTIPLLACALVPSARAQFSNVRLYGDVNLDFELVNGRQPDGSNPTVNRVSSNSSRVGVRGVEYIGGGNVAIFQVESGFFGDTGNSSSSTGNGTFASRETYVGLQGDWGTLRMGKFLTPYDDIHPIFGNSPTLTSSILSTAAIWAQGPLQKGQGGFDARLGNSIRYSSPNFFGLAGELQYSTRDSSGVANGAIGDNGDHPSEMRHAYVGDVAGFYNNGPVDFGIAYEHNNNVRAPLGRNDDALSIAGGYDLGTIVENVGLRLGGAYEYLRYDTPSGNLKRNFYAVSATLSVGDGVVYAFWGHSPNGFGSAAEGTQVGGLTKGPNSAATQWEVSYSYPLSLRTLLYAGFVQLANQVNAGYGFNINDYPTVLHGARLNGAVFGIAHFF